MKCSLLLILVVLSIHISPTVTRPHQHDHQHNSGGRMSMDDLYSRPLCLPEQSCSYQVLGVPLPFNFCDCPDEVAGCPSRRHILHQQGIEYQFCSRISIPLCHDGQVSVEVQGIQTAILCRCPSSHRLIKRNTQEFECHPIL